MRGLQKSIHLKTNSRCTQTNSYGGKKLKNLNGVISKHLKVLMMTMIQIVLAETFYLIRLYYDVILLLRNTVLRFN